MSSLLPELRLNAGTRNILTAMAFGDAFGAPYETPDGSRSPLEVVPYMIENKRLGTPFGQWTDDTALAAAGALALLRGRGTYDVERARELYTRAYTSNTVSGVKAPMNEYMLFTVLSQLPPLGWGRRVPEALISGVPGDSESCGALMRVPVLAYAANTYRVQDLASVVLLDTEITHTDPDVQLYSVAYALLHRYILSRPVYQSGRTTGHVLGSTDAALEYLSRMLCEVMPERQSKIKSRTQYLAALVNASQKAWASTCHDEFATGTAEAIFYSAVSLALRVRERVYRGETAFISSFAICEEACRIGGDTDTRCALTLPLCWQVGSLSRNFSCADFIGALDVALTAHQNNNWNNGAKHG